MVETRKPPSAKILRELYVLSGNLCARPGCNTVLVNANGTMVAEVCHICAESPGGPRYNKSLTPEERNSAANLLLLCGTCHALVDAEPEKYTVKILKGWKSAREGKFKAVGESLRQRYLDISDEAHAADNHAAKTLRRFRKFMDKQGHSHTIDSGTVEYVGSYLERLKHLAMPDRQLMVAIIEKALSLGGRREGQSGIHVHPDDLKTILVSGSRLSDYRIKKLANTLNRNSLGYLDVDEEPELSVSVIDEDISWSDLSEYLEQRGAALRDLICDLKFSLLD